MAWHGRGSSRAWRKKRKRVLDRDGPRCQLQLDGCTHRATTAHHTVPWQGDPADTPLEHLIGACAHCNTSAGDPTDHDPHPRTGTQW